MKVDPHHLKDFLEWHEFNCLQHNCKHSKEYQLYKSEHLAQEGVTIVAGKYKGKQGVIRDFTKSKVYIYLTEENSRLVLLPFKSVFGKENKKDLSLAKDKTDDSIQNLSTESCFKKGDLVSVIRGTYESKKGIIVGTTPKMVYLQIVNSGITVRIRKTSIALIIATTVENPK